MLVGLVTMVTGGGQSKNAPFCVIITGVVTAAPFFVIATGVVTPGCIFVEGASLHLLDDVVTTMCCDDLAIASLDVTGTHELNVTSDPAESILTMVGVEVLFN